MATLERNERNQPEILCGRIWCDTLIKWMAGIIGALASAIGGGATTQSHLVGKRRRRGFRWQGCQVALLGLTSFLIPVLGATGVELSYLDVGLIHSIEQKSGLSLSGWISLSKLGARLVESLVGRSEPSSGPIAQVSERVRIRAASIVFRTAVHVRQLDDIGSLRCNCMMSNRARIHYHVEYCVDELELCLSASLQIDAVIHACSRMDYIRENSSNSIRADVSAKSYRIGMHDFVISHGSLSLFSAFEGMLNVVEQAPPDHPCY